MKKIKSNSLVVLGFVMVALVISGVVGFFHHKKNSIELIPLEIVTCENYDSSNTKATDNNMDYQLSEEMMKKFFWIQFEGGNPKYSTASVGVMNDMPNAVYAGALCWTTTKEYNSIGMLINHLVISDREFYSPLAELLHMSNQEVIDDISDGENSKIGTGFRAVDEKNHDRFLKDQLEYAEDGFAAVLKLMDMQWIYEKDPITIGSVYSMLNYYPAGLEKSLSENNSDQEIIDTLEKEFNEIAGYNDRNAIKKQYELAKELVGNPIPKDVSDMFI